MAENNGGGRKSTTEADLSGLWLLPSPVTQGERNDNRFLGLGGNTSFEVVPTRERASRQRERPDHHKYRRHLVHINGRALTCRRSRDE